MSRFFFQDKNLNQLSRFDASNEHLCRVMTISGPFVSPGSIEAWRTVLHIKSRKFDHIALAELFGDSPPLVAFLELICNSTDRLLLFDCNIGIRAASCLMSAVVPKTSILYLLFRRVAMATNVATRLLEGVARSSCLTTLMIRVDSFAHNHTVGVCLIDALQQNQSLQDITLSTTCFTPLLHRIIEASILVPTLTTLNIEDSYAQDMSVTRRDLPIYALNYALCRRECTLEKLYIYGLSLQKMPNTSWWCAPLDHNTTVTKLYVRYSEADSENMANFLKLYKSLVHLDVSFNRITDFSFLQPLLFGGVSPLKCVDLSNNRIGQDDLEAFLPTLQKVKGLKHLKIGSNPWESSFSTHALLIDALRKNTDIEHVDFDSGDLPLDLNRGGRRVFDSLQGSFPTNLLPLVLERALKVSYYKHSDKWGKPTNSEARLDVAFGMIQGIAPLIDSQQQPTSAETQNDKNDSLPSQRGNLVLLSKTASAAICRRLSNTTAPAASDKENVSPCIGCAKK